MRGFPLAVAAIFALVALAGCISDPKTQSVETSAGPVSLPLDVHIVAVGFESFDAEAVEQAIDQPGDPFELIRAFNTGHVEKSLVRYDVTLHFHTAPDAFAEALFTFANSTAQPMQPDRYLANYDRNRENRVCEAPLPLPVSPPVNSAALDTPCTDITTLDAEAVEDWIAENRGAYDLAFDGFSRTFFILDSYTKGYLPKDGYHQWRVDDQTDDRDVTNMRAWGGDHDFMFLDMGAAPNNWDDYPFLIFDDQGVRDYDRRDGPIWEYTGNEGPMWANIGRNIADGIRMKVARDPIYPVEYAEAYDLPMYIYIDPQAHTNPDSVLSRLRPADVEAQTNVTELQAAFEALVPWADVNLTVEFRYLPDDDPGMAAALADAKNRYSSAFVDYGILKSYVRDNWDQYVTEKEGVRSYPTFAFMLDAPSAGLYAFADGNERGESWGVFVNAADIYLCLRPEQPVCHPEDIFASERTWWSWWNAVLVHELGHSFGLMHPHDTGDLVGPDGDEVGIRLNWLWDSTRTVMTYRHTFPVFDAFDRSFMERHVAMQLTEEVLLSDASDAAKATATRARDAALAGDFTRSLELARKAFHDAGSPMRTIERTDGEVVTQRVLIPTTDRPAGTPPVFFIPFGVGSFEGVDYASIDYTVEEGVDEVQFEFREVDRPTHMYWAGYLVLLDNDGDFVTGAFDNGHGIVVLEDVERCEAGCEVRIYAYSGFGLEYDVSITPRTVDVLPAGTA